jgi:hypothetical protein
VRRCSIQKVRLRCQIVALALGTALACSAAPEPAPTGGSATPARPGVTFDRIEWPHGAGGKAEPHGALFAGLSARR